MRDKIKDKERLLHMKNAILEIQSQTSQEWKDNIEKNHLMFYSLVKLLEIIGEAAYMLTKDFKNMHKDLYWQPIEDMRHVLVHGYYKIDITRLIETIDNDLSFILSKIELFLAEDNAK